MTHQYIHSSINRHVGGAYYAVDEPTRTNRRTYFVRRGVCIRMKTNNAMVERIRNKAIRTNTLVPIAVTTTLRCVDIYTGRQRFPQRVGVAKMPV